MRGWGGEVPGGLDAVARASSWAWSAARRLEPGPDRRRSAADCTGRAVPTAFRRRAPGPGGRCLAVASFGRAVLGRAAVLSRLRPSEDGIAVHPGLALLLRRRAGTGCHVLDRDLGRGPARPCGRCDRGHHRPVEGCRRAPHRRGPVADRGPAHRDRQRRRLRRHPPDWVLRDLPVELVGRVRSDRACVCRSRRGRKASTAGHPYTVRNSASPSRKPGPSPRSRTPPTRARPKPRHGTGSTQGSPTATSTASAARVCPADH